MSITGDMLCDKHFPITRYTELQALSLSTFEQKGKGRTTIIANEKDEQYQLVRAGNEKYKRRSASSGFAGSVSLLVRFDRRMQRRGLKLVIVYS